jgi:hypothetical protein
MAFPKKNQPEFDISGQFAMSLGAKRCFGGKKSLNSTIFSNLG